MAFEVQSCHLGDVVVLVSKSFSDHRRYFMETYRDDQLRELGCGVLSPGTTVPIRKRELSAACISNGSHPWVN
jgi:dTDP-4-dehydrorhamnose 3,5-epimerase-like enzyme